MVTLSIILSLSIFIWVIFLIGDLPPNVIIHHLSVSKFEILDSRLVAELVARFTIFVFIPTPPGATSPVFSDFSFFEHIEAFVSYKDHILTVNSTKIEQEWEVVGHTTMSVKFSTKELEGDQREVKDWVLEDIRKVRDNGTVIFGMEMVIWTLGYSQSYVRFWACKWTIMAENYKRKVKRKETERDFYWMMKSVYTSSKENTLHRSLFIVYKIDTIKNHNWIITTL